MWEKWKRTSFHQQTAATYGAGVLFLFLIQLLFFHIDVMGRGKEARKHDIPLFFFSFFQPVGKALISPVILQLLCYLAHQSAWVNLGQMEQLKRENLAFLLMSVIKTGRIYITSHKCTGRTAETFWLQHLLWFELHRGQKCMKQYILFTFSHLPVTYILVPTGNVICIFI